MSRNDQWLEWAKELQFLSQCALAYCKDKYDIQRFRRIREISAEMIASLSDLPIETVRYLFCSESGYQTPKLDTRAVVIRDGKLLLVQEEDGTWALPGGWVDYNLSVRKNAEKEVLEEAGIRVRALRLIALYDHNARHALKAPWEITSAFVLCEYLGGSFVPNPETVSSGFFSPEEIPSPLAPGKTTEEQIETCFKAAADENWKVILD